MGGDMSAEIFTHMFSKNSKNIPVSNDQSNAYANQADESSLFEEETEGQLAVDVYQKDDHIVIRSTVAGVRPEDIDISIEGDMLTIKGYREEDKEVNEDEYLYRECYWGAFSRSIILPTEVIGEEAEATMKNGVLTIKVPKMKKTKSVSVKVSTE